MAEKSDLDATEVLYLEPLPPSTQLSTITTTMNSKNYTVNRLHNIDTRILTNIRRLTIGLAFICLLALTSFVTYNEMLLNNTLSNFTRLETTSILSLSNTSKNVTNLRDCVTAYKQQMLLVESWQHNGSKEFFQQCSYQFPLDNSNYFSICNTSAPLRPIYDLRYFVGDDHSFYPTVRGFLLTSDQAYTLRNFLNELLPIKQL